MRKQNTRSDQSVIWCIQQGDRDLVRGVVASPRHEVVQTEIRIDQAWRCCAVRHVVVALTRRISAGPLGKRGWLGSHRLAVVTRVSPAALLLTHGRTLVLSCQYRRSLCAQARR